MKKLLIRYFLLALFLALCGVAVSKSIRSGYKSIRTDYFMNAKGKTQHFINSYIR